MRPAVSNKGRYRSYSGKISKGQLRTCDGRYYAGFELKQGSVAYCADHCKSHGGYLFGREDAEKIEDEEWVELTEEVLAQAKRT